MNMKKILSSALVVLTLFASIAGLIPVTAGAAEAVNGGTIDNVDAASRGAIVLEAYKDYDRVFTTADERLEYELSKGYLISVNSTGGLYTIYVNQYTGMMYYKNNSNGKILTSNPVNYKNLDSDSARDKLMSQISLKYSLDTGAKVPNNGIILSAPDAAKKGQINVSYIANGIRVNYTIGDTTTRYNVPMQILEEDFINDIFNPMLEFYQNLFTEVVVPDGALKGIVITEDQYDFYGKEIWSYEKTSFGSSKPQTVSGNRLDEYGNLNVKGLQTYLDYTKQLAEKVYPAATEYENPNRKEVNYAYQALYNLLANFVLVEPKNTAVYGEGGTSYTTTTAKIKYYQENPGSDKAVYMCPKQPSDAGLDTLQGRLAKYAGYTVDMLLVHEEACFYEADVIENPVFKCSLEYTFNTDGSLSVRLPVNSITFNEAVYNLDSITPLQYMGAGNLTGDGYVFMPDGSGSIMDYADFRSGLNIDNISLKLLVYGDDFAYANPAGKHTEKVSMPIFGVTTRDTEANMLKDTAATADTKGFFAILEEGAALASIAIEFGGNETRRGAIYGTYSPYPSDKYVSNSAVGGSTSTYTIVSDSKYTGSYVTRYVLLGDDCKYGDTEYAASYAGMATYYRDYLKAKGDLKKIETFSEDLPLYIEALGSMNVVEKILTFPVTVSKPLTTFDDIVTMYNELSDVKKKFDEKAAEYEAKAVELKDNKTLANKYSERAAEYKRLSAEMESIKNINFRLTGFANGGMYYTYPSKVKWESSVGGKNGFRELIKTAADLTKDGASFGVYPEFDFVYRNNTAWNDGISTGTDLSRMVDNRYASKQVYNSVLGIYESFYSMVISTDVMDGFYTKFEKKYGKYEHEYISLSTLGSDLNSNLDRENAINRHESSENVVALLDRIANTDGYEIMTDVGNSYALGYADHILNITTDSSHYINSSYTVPFIGMVLHGYVRYAGSPLNYAGSPSYEILRAIENGASPYYILCYENTEFMKEDELLNDYYGIDYKNWYDKLVQQYNVLNKQIGDLQSWEITDHRVILAERIIDEKEEAANLELLKAEFIELVVEDIEIAIDAAFDAATGFGTKINLTVDAAALANQAQAFFNVKDDEWSKTEYIADIVFDDAETSEIYTSDSTEATQVAVSAISDYAARTKYDFVTDSFADDKNYDYTDYTATNKRVVVVTYKNTENGKTVSFILNYSVYAVEVKLDATHTYEIEQYGFKRIEG